MAQQARGRDGSDEEHVGRSSVAFSRSAQPYMVHLAQRLFNTPLAIDPGKYEVILQAIGSRVLESRVQAAELSPLVTPTLLDLSGETHPIHAGYGSDSNNSSSTEYEVTADGVGIICVRGTLVKKSSWASATSGLVSYASIGRQLQACLGDPQVRAVLLDINSPGGETHGMFDLADLIYQSRSQGKLIYGIANDAALSAAYAIASSCDRIYVTRTGAVGSIGVFSCHVDQSGADEAAGVKFTYIHAGAKKIDGNPHSPLSKRARTDAQAEVDRQYSMFVDTVARNRGIDVSQAIDTEAGVLFADAGIDLLADDVGTFDDCYLALCSKSGIVVPMASGTAAGKNVSGKSVAQTIAARLEAGSITPAFASNLKSRIAAIAATESGAKWLDEHRIVESVEGAAPMAKLTLASTDELLEILSKKADEADDADDAKKGEDSKKSKKKAEADDAEDGKKADDADDAEGKKSAATSAEAKKGKKGEYMKDKEKPGDKQDDSEPDDDEDEKNGQAAAMGMGVEYAEEVMNLCSLAGMDNLARGFISKRKPLKAVRLALAEKRSALANDPSRSTSGFGVAQTTALDQIMQQAKAMAQASGGRITVPQAYEKVLRANPQMYMNYLDEAEDAKGTRKSQRAYLDGLRARLQGYDLLKGAIAQTGTMAETISNSGDAAQPR